MGIVWPDPLLLGLLLVVGAVLCFGWALLLVWSAILLWPGAGQNRRRGLRLLVGGVLWMLLSLATWLSLPVRIGPKFVAPDGVSAVWARQGLGYSHRIRWRSPRGDGDLLIGPAPDIYPDGGPPSDIAWLPSGDAFYIGWAGEPDLPEPPVVEVATGTHRYLTPEEVEWLLQPGRLKLYAHDYLQEVAEQNYGYAAAEPSG